MNYTSIEQSKKLLELGLSPETADMFYPNAPVTVPCVDDGRSKGSIFIPCWSVEALREAMPKENEHTNPYGMYNAFVGYGDRLYRCVYLNGDWESAHQEVAYSAVDACYRMVVWLLENGYIKKGE